MANGSRFEYCVNFVLGHETEYHADKTVRVERDPADPGGTTKYGIDQRDHPNVDVAALSLQEAKNIYYDEEWSKCRCPNLKPGWDLAVFDAAVNIGMARAIRLAQQSVASAFAKATADSSGPAKGGTGEVALKVDGVIGPKTVVAINNSSIDVLADYLDLREAYYRGLPLPLRSKFLNGWLARVADVRVATLSAKRQGQGAQIAAGTAASTGGTA